jgi:hypothetical protein
MTPFQAGQRWRIHGMRAMGNGFQARSGASPSDFPTESGAFPQGGLGCAIRAWLLCSGSRERALRTGRFAICIEEWPVLLLKSCRCSSGASRWPLWPAPSGEVGSRFVGRIGSVSSSSPCRESRREQTHCMTREEIPFVRAKCARRFIAGRCLKFCAVRPSAAD